MNLSMQRYVRRTLVACAAGIVLMFVDVMAQTPPAHACAWSTTQGAVQTPRRSNGVPDFSGVWVPTRAWGTVAAGGFARFDPKTGALDAAQPHQQSRRLRAGRWRGAARVPARAPALVFAQALGARAVQRRPRTQRAGARPRVSMHA